MKNWKHVVWIVAVAMFVLLPALPVMAQSSISYSMSFDLNDGFDTAAIENPDDMHEPDWSDWIVTQMGMDPSRGIVREVETRAGKKIDILTCCEAVEVEWAVKWYEAIGQSLFYGIETNRPPSIILLSRDSKKERQEIDNCKVVCARTGIRLYVQRVPARQSSKVKEVVKPKLLPIPLPLPANLKLVDR